MGNKTAVYALMDKIAFDRERYRLGHTLVFFRAGALAGLEEKRDELVIKWIRMIQGEVYKRIRGKEFAKRRDQRELIKVCQRNFRKFLAMRDWGWFIIIQKTRGLIGLPNPEEELRLLEEKANATYGEYQAALATTANLESQMGNLKDEIAAMSKQLAEEQGSISVYTDRQAKATQLKTETEMELAKQQKVLASEEQSRVQLAAEVKAHSGSISAVKKDIEDVELAILKVEQEKANRDHTIKVLQDEIAEQDEVINKLNREKKHLSATQAKSNEDLVSAEEKVSHLTSVKSQLQSTLDQLEGGLDKEKKARATLEKQKRKVEGDLKMAQDTVADLERTKREIEGVIANKEKNNQLLSAKLDDEQSLVAKAQKNIKELQGRVEASAEQELADTNETLADLGNVNQSIAAAKRKLEAEFNQLGADLDEMTNEARLSEEKAARAMVDAARLADELRCEQDAAMSLEKDKKLLEAQCKDAASRADEAEINALKGGRKAMIRMEARIRDLESELEAENRRSGDMTRNLRKSERTISELTFAADEDKKNHERMQSLIDQLQGKVKSCKKQIEEAEELAALNLAKYRKVAGALGDATAEADANEQIAAMRKARARSVSVL